MHGDDAIDHEALRASIRQVLDAECTPGAVLKHVERGGGADLSLWAVARNLGWMAMAAPDHLDGLGLGLDALAILYEELGRAVAPLPLLPSTLVLEALQAAGSAAQQARWLPPLAAGELKASLSPPAPCGTIPVSVVSQAGERLALSGRAENLLDGADADLILVLGRDPHGALVRVMLEPAQDGIDVLRQPTWDGTRSLAAIDLDDVAVPADRILPVSLDQECGLADHAALALAADSIGGGWACLSLTIDYLKTRQQFGKPIGSFQALKHRVANLQVALVADTALLRSAAALAAAGDTLASTEIAAAKAHICRNYVELARDCIQLHGGIGFTTEYVVHLFLKRARLNEALFGGAGQHLDRVLDHMLRRTAA